MGPLIERLALYLIAKGVEATVAWALAADMAPLAAGDSNGCPDDACALSRCRMRGDPRIEDDCYAWDEPSSWRH